MVGALIIRINDDADLSHLKIFDSVPLPNRLLIPCFVNARIGVVMTGNLATNMKQGGGLGVHRCISVDERLADQMTQKLASDYVDAVAWAAIDTLQLLSCKNVSLSPRRQPDSSAVTEATRRNGGHAVGYRYHVLVVRPPGAKSDSPGVEIDVMPRHVCRGHFAEYGLNLAKGFCSASTRGDSTSHHISRAMRRTELLRRITKSPHQGKPCHPTAPKSFAPIAWSSAMK